MASKRMRAFERPRSTKGISRGDRVFLPYEKPFRRSCLADVEELLLAGYVRVRYRVAGYVRTATVHVEETRLADKG